MKNLKNSPSEVLKKGNSIDTSIKNNLVVEGSLIPVMEEQGIKICVANGKLTVSYRDENFEQDKIENYIMYSLGYGINRKKIN